MKTIHPLLLFSPFLFMYILLILYLQQETYQGDEERYMMFAENLLQGYYSPPNELNLWNGPGYPLFLVPFVFFEAPLLAIKLCNAFFLYASVILLFHAVKRVCNVAYARFFAFAWAIYYVAWQTLPLILTETISILLIALSIYFIVNSYVDNKNKDKILAGLSLGFLALTKVIFGYVILCTLLLLFLAKLIRFLGKKQYDNRAITILLFALAPLLPYLFYTYQLTGKPLYFADSGGMSLYFMSTPYEGEFGDWNTPNFMGYCDGGIQPCNAPFFLKNHKEEIEYIYAVEGVARDERFKAIAIENIKNHPIKFLRNCLANQGRMWFRYPFSFRFQNDLYLGIAFPNAVLFTLFLYMLLFWLLNFLKITKALNLIFLLLMIYLGGSTLLSAYPRQLYVVVPMILILVSFALYRSTNIQFRIQ